MDCKARSYTLISSNGNRETLHCSIAYAMKIADHIMAAYDDMPYVDIYSFEVHRVRVYHLDAKDAGTPPIMYLSKLNQSLAAT